MSQTLKLELQFWKMGYSKIYIVNAKKKVLALATSIKEE